MEIIIAWLGIGVCLYIAIEWAMYISLFVSNKEKRQVRQAWKTIILGWPILMLYGMLLICAWVCEDIWSDLGEIIRSNHGNL